jgi:hypothetical protein
MRNNEVGKKGSKMRCRRSYVGYAEAGPVDGRVVILLRAAKERQK